MAKQNIGLIGMAVMGQNLALNMENLSLAESLFPVSPASSSLHDIFSEFVNNKSF